MAASISARLVRSRVKVRSLLIDLTSDSVTRGRSSMPAALCAKAAAFTPKTPLSWEGWADARSPSVRMPSACSLRADCLPMPGMALTSMGARKARSLPG